MSGHEDRVSPACDNRLNIRSGSTLKFSPADVPAGAGVGVLENSPEEYSNWCITTHMLGKQDIHFV